MIEKEFDALLTSYLDGHISDNELYDLERAIQDNPEYKERFQSEIRLQTLMREAALARLELNGQRIGNILRSYGTKTLRSSFTIIMAACIVLVGLIFCIWLIPGRINDQPVVGVCLQTYGNGGVMIERNKNRIVIGQNNSILEGDRILSGPRAQGVMQLTDGVILSLEGGSSVYLKGTEIFLEQGEALFEVDVSDLIKQAGQYTIIVKQDPFGDFNDISFASKESLWGPRLIIYQQQIEQQADFGKGFQ